MEKTDLVIIGSGMAGGRLLEEILKRAPDQYRITVVGAERYGNYNRILLSPVLAGEMEAADIMLNTPQWYASNSINFISGDPVIRIDTETNTITTLNGRQLSYDKLVLATGSSPIIPPSAKDAELTGVLSFRNLDDVEKILARAGLTRHAVVLGGGLLGLEAAYGLRQYGIEVTVVHRGPWLLNRQLDETAGELLKQALETRGIKVRLNCEVTGYCSEHSASSTQDSDAKSKVQHDSQGLTAVTLSDGTLLKTELAVIAIGISPNTRLAQTSGIECDRGILVNDRMQSAHHNIYALGECTQFGQDTFGLVAPLWDQAKVLADQLTTTRDSRYRVKPCATKLKVSGIDLFSAGEFIDGNDTESLVFKDLKQNIYKKLMFRDQLLVGAVLYGAVQDGNWYFDLIQQQQPVRHLSPDLIFGQRFIPDVTNTDDSEQTTEPVVAATAPPAATPITENPITQTPEVSL